MTDFFTSDAHFFHRNIFLFESKSRPFLSVDIINKITVKGWNEETIQLADKALDDMYNAIIERWNNKIYPQDTTFILGDVTFERTPDLSLTIDILNSLNGRKILIKGNHDSYSVRNENFRDCFESIHDIFDYKINKKHYVLCHYPMISWRNSRRGSKQLFGHEHSKFLGNREQLNVGMDCHNLTPISIEEIDNILLTLEEKTSFL